MKKVLLFLSVCMCSVSVMGQHYARVSGYLGSRLTIGGGINVSPSWQPQKSNYTTGLGANLAFRVSSEFATSSYRSFGLKLETLTTSMVFNETSNYFPIDWNSDGIYYQLRDIQGRPSLRSSSIGLYVKFFLKRRGALSPVGKYISLGLDICKISGDFSDVTYVVKPSDGFNNLEDIKYKYKNPVISEYSPMCYVAFGNAIPIGRRLLLDYQINGGLFLAGINNPVENMNSPEILQHYAFSEMEYRFRRVYAINFSLKLNLML